jgi:PEP-CTERM motif
LVVKEGLVNRNLCKTILMGLIGVALASPSLFAGEDLVAGFENTNATTNAGPYNTQIAYLNQPGAVNYSTTDGVTQGDYSVEITHADTWLEALYAAHLFPVLATHDYMSIDVTVPAEAEYANLIFIQNASTIGYTSVPFALTPGTTQTVTWYYGAEHPASVPGFPGLESFVTLKQQNASAVWSDFYVALNIDGDASTEGQQGGIVYIDNFRLGTIPEPATLSLVGIGLVCFGLARRRLCPK